LACSFFSLAFLGQEVNSSPSSSFASNATSITLLNEILLLCVCATIAECDSFEAIADWGNDHLGFLRRFLPFDWGVPSGRWINIMMNRIDPDLFAACFMDWVRACWPEPPDTIAIDGKTVRRSHDRSRGRAALHLVSAFATNSRLVLGQETVDDKTNETTVIPLLLEKLAAGRSLEGALVTIDAIACNPHIAQSIRDAGADYLLAVKGNQPTLQADIEAAFETAEKGQVEIDVDLDKGHGRIETRTVSVLRQVDWLDGDRRFPGEVRFVDARDRQGRSEDRAKGSLPVRRAILHYFQRSLRRRALPNNPRPLGHREHAARDARRDLPGGLLARAQGPRSPKHGARAQVRLQ
jgi:predicted transposase YbfD/YdcC